MLCCLNDGDSCSFGDVCCSGICAPDPNNNNELRCGSQCIADGQPCTADADCCGCACISDGAGGQVCTSDPTECSACTGAQLGELCQQDSDCCNPESVRCNTGPTIEFPTCILR